MVQEDVAAIDVNMGCPKEFSVKGGMGVALMANLELAKQILTGLVAAVSIPVTCKIRVLKSTEETIRVVKELESTGISAIAVHGRTRDERPQHQVNPGMFYILHYIQSIVKYFNCRHNQSSCWCN